MTFKEEYQYPFMAEDSFASNYEKIGDIFSKSIRYEVPPYQRDFSWKQTTKLRLFGMI